LGSNDGAPVSYHWTPPNPLPHLLPWLATLALLLLKSNRTAKAWWIWLPLAFVAAAEAIVRPHLESVGSEVLDYFCMVFNSQGFGIAAVWLLAATLGHRLRFLVFLKMLGVTAAVSAFCYLVRSEWDGAALGFVIMVGVCVVIAVIGLNLAGLVCRRRYRPLALTLWLALFIAALWLLLSAPFAVIAMVSGSNGPSWLEFLGVVLSLAGLTFGMLLPFLVLGFLNGLFRERLKELLHLNPVATPPPVLVSPPPLANPPSAI
jgi:hypothetical protein